MMTEENNINGTERIVSKYDETRDLQGNTELHRLVQLAIENDFAMPVQQDENGNSLSYADLILLEISKGANIYAKNNAGKTPLGLMQDAFDYGKATWNSRRQTPYVEKEYKKDIKESYQKLKAFIEQVKKMPSSQKFEEVEKKKLQEIIKRRIEQQKQQEEQEKANLDNFRVTTKDPNRIAMVRELCDWDGRSD